MSKEIYIRQFEGFNISYNKWSKKFEAKKGDVKIKANTEEELIALVKTHIREKKKFKPIEVIKVDSDKVGRITSRVADDDRDVWFSFKEDGQPKHTKEALEGVSWSYDKAGKPRFVEATGSNLLILGEISELELKIDNLQKQIRAKRQSYEKPVTWESIEKQTGESRK